VRGFAHCGKLKWKAPIDSSVSALHTILNAEIHPSTSGEPTLPCRCLLHRALHYPPESRLNTSLIRSVRRLVGHYGQYYGSDRRKTWAEMNCWGFRGGIVRPITSFDEAYVIISA